jgi:diamine N-acetyltransferase
MEREDIDHIYLWENDPEIWRVGATTEPISRNRIEEWIRHQSYDIYATRQRRLIIEAEGKVVGSVDIFEFDPQHLRFGIGILIYAPEARGKGYAHAAIEAIKTYARDTLALKQIWASVAADNEASIALFEGCGFELCGTRKAWLRRHNGYTDQLEYQCML